MDPQRLTVAIVDDEYAVRRALGRLLRSAGLGVEIYSSGADFLGSLRDRHPDCVVLDVSMPGLTGFDVQAQLAAQDEPLPVIFISALDDPEGPQRAMQAGACAFLSKPFQADELLAAIDSATKAFRSKHR